MKRSGKGVSSLRAIDFFCGAGGVTCGFNKSGIEVLAGIDIDSECKNTYEKNNKGAKFIQADISAYSPEQLIADTGITREDDNLIFIGCSPCQYYTIIQTSKEKSAKSKLLLEDFRDFVAYFRPGYVFIENVPGIETNTDSPLQSFKKFLKKEGYVFADKVVNAKYYNVPQNRRRYVLIATRVHPSISVPKDRKNARMTVKHFIGKGTGFERISAGKTDKSRLQHSTAKLTDINIKRLKKTPKNGGTRLSWKNHRSLQLKCYKDKDDMFIDVYGRMYWDRPAPTITTKFLSITNGRFGHPSQTRGISLREGATLQSFPRSYRFYADKNETIARMIGNAVPPNMAKKVGDALVKMSKVRQGPVTETR